MKTFILAATLILLSSHSTHAAGAGTGSSGGGVGNSAGDILDNFDDEEIYRGKLTRLRPETLPAYKNIVAPLIKDVEEKLPGFKEEITKALKDKRWSTTKEKLPRTNDECLAIDIGAKQLAVQTSEDIVIDETWLKNKDTKEESIAALIMHELLMHVKGEKNTCSTYVRRANKTLQNQDRLSDVELQQELVKNGFFRNLKPISILAKDRQEALEKLRPIINFCQLSINENLTIGKLNGIIAPAYESLVPAIQTINADMFDPHTLKDMWSPLAAVNFGLGYYMTNANNRDQLTLSNQLITSFRVSQKEACKPVNEWMQKNAPSKRISNDREDGSDTFAPAN